MKESDKTEVPAIVIGVNETTATCLVHIGEIEMTMDFPISFIDFYTLRVGDRFKWLPTEDGSIGQDNIVPGQRASELTDVDDSSWDSELLRKLGESDSAKPDQEIEQLKVANENANKMIGDISDELGTIIKDLSANQLIWNIGGHPEGDGRESIPCICCTHRTQWNSGCPEMLQWNDRYKEWDDAEGDDVKYEADAVRCWFVIPRPPPIENTEKEQ